MQNALTVIQVAVSALLIVAVLLQQRGVGLSAAFGGEGNVFRTKRGVEKILFHATIVLSVLFLASGVAGILLAAK
jgi:preprotein translocase subunit SecG